LIKETLAAIGENIMTYKRANGMSRDRVLGCISTILDEQAQDNPRNRLTSNVFIVNLLCANIKRMYGLRHATHVTLGTIYQHVRRANSWFEDHLLNAEFQLVQATDLAIVLGYGDIARTPRMVTFSSSDIRLHFPPTH
jgi:hypothetical protein